MIKRDSTDAIVSDVVREAADWCCERCQMPFPDRKSRNCHASHFISRKYNSVRFFPDNLTCLCGACHDLLGKDPYEHAKFMETKLGLVRLEELRQRKQRVVRYRNGDKAEMRKHYRGELERLRDLRTAGAVGVLSVVAYD